MTPNDALNGIFHRLMFRVKVAQEADTLLDVKMDIELVENIFTAHGEAELINMLNAKIKNAAYIMLRAEREYLAGCRKNCRTRAGTETEIKKLEQMA